MPSWLVIICQVFYSLAAVGLAIYGLHSIWLLWLLWRRPPNLLASPCMAERTSSGWPATAWPRVTVQLPIYNEQHVVERLIDACARLDYPKSRLEIQVLDDSDDETTALAQRTVRYWRRQGCDISLVRRVGRQGFKAGALAHALGQAKGEFIAIFDADFLPPADFLRRTVCHFLTDTNADVGFVQARWDHLNRTYSLLTRCQALALDGHFGVEQPARANAGFPFGFNGSAGVWRRRCIDDPAVGGWNADTLCEDLDLAYRAQMAGWRGLFLADVAAPAEIPPQMLAFKRQQFRWAKGSVQTLKKLAHRVWGMNWSLAARLAGMVHLGNYLIHPLLIVLLLTTLPLLLERSNSAPPLAALSLASFGPPLLYAVAQWRLHGRRWFQHWSVLPVLMLLGLGLSLNNTIAVWQGLTGQGGAFLRTPKFRIETADDEWRRSSYRLVIESRLLGEAALGLYALATVAVAIGQRNWWTAMFMAIYAASFATMALVEIWQARMAREIVHSDKSTHARQPIT